LELISALAWLTIPALMGPVIGPPLGGFITTFASWRWIFWINIPIGVLGVILATYYIQNFREEELPPLDVKGFILSGVGLSGLAFGFTTIGQGLFPPAVVAALLIVGFVGCFLYVRHARTAIAPLLDLSLLKIDTFFASVVGGFIYRVGIGATPFLLPLLLQLGFGLTPFQSGMLTFSTAVGAIAMKTTAAPILRRFGFKQVLVINALVSAIFIGVPAMFTPITPHGLILLLLLVGGFFKSLQFTSINTLAYADIEPRAMSAATSFASVAQQLSMSAGVAVGALVLEIQRHGRADMAVQASDFTTAFVVVGVISAASAFIFMRLPKGAGASLSAPRRPIGDARDKVAEAEARIEV
jgi:MFS family permease